MDNKDTPFERCIITAFLRDVLSNEPSAPVGPLRWWDYAIPFALFCFLAAVFTFMHFFPNGIWG